MLKIKIQNAPDYIINGIKATLEDLQALDERTENGTGKILKRVNKNGKHYIYTT